MLFSYGSFLFAFDAPIHQYPLDLSVGTYNVQGEEVDYFDVHDLVVITATIENLNNPSIGDYFYDNLDPGYGYEDGTGGPPIRYRIMITVIDPNGNPVYFDKSRSELGSGDIEDYSTSMSLQDIFVEGSYSIYVMVWDEWLPEGIALSSEVGSIMFDAGVG